MRALHATTTLLRRATIVGALACACTTIQLPCMGQQGEPPPPTVDTARPLVWTGAWVEDLPSVEDPRREQAERFAREQLEWWKETKARIDQDGSAAYPEILRRDLARARLDREVGKLDTSAYGRQLAVLIARAARSDRYPGRWEILQDIHLELGRWCAEAGLREVALFNTSRLLFPGGAVLPPYELVPASDELLAEEAEALMDPRLVAFRASLEAGVIPAAAPAAGQGQSIEDAVRDAVATDHPDLVLELGGRAGPALEAMVQSRLDEMPSRTRTDPLVLLFKVSELRGAQVVLDNWERGGFLFKKRVLRGMREAQVLQDVGTWSFTQMQAGRAEVTTDAPRMAEPIWLEVLARLASDPEVARDSLDAVGFVATFDALTEPLQGALIAALDRGDPDWVNDVLEALDRTRGRATVVPVLEHALDHSRQHVRAFAAERLALYPRNDALRARADHPDVAVRRAAARSLVGKKGTAAYREDLTAYWMVDEKRFSKDRSVDERDVACLERLLQDRDAQVREMATDALVRHPDLPIDSGLVVRLTRDASVGVRRMMTYWRSEQAVDPALLETLAADEDSEVLSRLDRRFDQMAQMGPNGSVVSGPGRSEYTGPLLWNDAYLDALLIRLANPAREFGAREALRASGRSREGASAIVAQALSTGRPEVIHAVLDAMESQWRSGNEHGAWPQVPPESLVAFVRTAWSMPPEWRGKWRLWRLLADWPRDSVVALASVLNDDAAPADLRLLTAYLSASAADAAWRESLLDVLAAAETPGGDERFNVADAVQGIPGRMADGAARQALLIDLMGRDVPDWSTAVLSRGLSKEAALDEALAIRILERYGDRDGTEWAPLLGVALRALKPTDEEPQLELLERLMTNSTALEGVLEVMSRTHLDVHLPVLEDGLMGRGFDNPNDRMRVQVLSAGALASYLDDEAAEILLKGLGSTNDTTVRDACFAALETIRRYQDEKERWAQRKSSKQARDAAIAELVPMLADSDTNVRAQAARSLGALGAVEQLPALVRMLKDPDATVRAAAQAAIEALTATPEKD